MYERRESFDLFQILGGLEEVVMILALWVTQHRCGGWNDDPMVGVTLSMDSEIYTLRFFYHDNTKGMRLLHGIIHFHVDNSFKMGR